jgi:cytochrome o ubiquinol oxidase subunit IV
VENQVTFKAYLLGFVFSLVLTLMAYFLVVGHLLTGHSLLAAIVGLGVIQMVIQLHFFFHMDTEPKPRWNTLMFLFMALVLVVIVFGSLWIMYNLNYNDM